jgi:hypothetical protein
MAVIHVVTGASVCFCVFYWVNPKEGSPQLSVQSRGVLYIWPGAGVGYFPPHIKLFVWSGVLLKSFFWRGNLTMTYTPTPIPASSTFGPVTALAFGSICVAATSFTFMHAVGGGLAPRRWAECAVRAPRACRQLPLLVRLRYDCCCFRPRRWFVWVVHNIIV